MIDLHNFRVATSQEKVKEFNKMWREILKSGIFYPIRLLNEHFILNKRAVFRYVGLKEFCLVIKYPNNVHTVYAYIRTHTKFTYMRI